MSMCSSRSTMKSVHGDLFVQHVVKGSEVRKVQICFYEGSNVEYNLQYMKTNTSNVLPWSTIIVFTVPSSFDLWLEYKTIYG